MTIKDLLIEELEDVPEPLIIEVLDFLRFLKVKQVEDLADCQDARLTLAGLEAEGTVGWEDLKAELGL
jgi:hypothetical protein